MPTDNSSTQLKRIAEIQTLRLVAEYTQRYQQIITQLPPGLLLHKSSLNEADWRSDAKTISIIHAYIDLCAEQLSLWRGGYIPDSIWQNWDEGIRATFELRAVSELWNSFFQHSHYNDLRTFLQSSPPAVKLTQDNKSAKPRK